MIRRNPIQVRPSLNFFFLNQAIFYIVAMPEPNWKSLFASWTRGCWGVSPEKHPGEK